MFEPSDFCVPDEIFFALMVQIVFCLIYSNPYERARINRVSLRVESIRERRTGAIEGAWSDKNEASAGEHLNIKVLVRPYRGAPVLREVPIVIPASARGQLRI